MGINHTLRAACALNAAVSLSQREAVVAVALTPEDKEWAHVLEQCETEHDFAALRSRALDDPRAFAHSLGHKLGSVRISYCFNGLRYKTRLEVRARIMAHLDTPNFVKVWIAPGVKGETNQLILGGVLLGDTRTDGSGFVFTPGVEMSYGAMGCGMDREWASHRTMGASFYSPVPVAGDLPDWDTVSSTKRVIK